MKTNKTKAKYKIIEFNKDEMGNNDNIIGMVKIYDYSILVNAEGNRNLNARALKDIRDSIAVFGLISCPIAVQKGKKFIIIDGWHRKYVSEESKSTLTLILVNVPKDSSVNSMMIALDTTQHNWNLGDFLNHGIIYHKKDDYVDAAEIVNDMGISVGAVINLYASDRSNTVNKALFEHGTWTISTKSLGNKTVRYAQELQKSIPFSMSSNFLHGFIKVVNKKGYNQKQMVQQSKKFIKYVYDCHNPSDFVNMLNKVYNHCVLEEEQVYLGR